jgi:SAM-dependent methyltransferase
MSVGFYCNVVFPRLCDWVMDLPQLAAHRRELLADVYGEVLEIGVGSGLNLLYYPEHVRKVTTIDPNAGMSKLLLKRIQQTGKAVDHFVVGAETLPFEGAAFDCVVSTWTLCSIRGVERAMRELYRVLKPGGRFVFLEHGLSDRTGVRTWQRRLNGLQMFVAGCRLDLNVSEVFAGVPFAAVEIENFYLEKTPKTHGCMYQGAATK